MEPLYREVERTLSTGSPAMTPAAIVEEAIRRFREEEWPEMKRQPDWVRTYVARVVVGEKDSLAMMCHIRDTFGHEAPSERDRRTLDAIIAQEEGHVAMFSALLLELGGQIPDQPKTWIPNTLISWASGCAIAARGEEIRLGEITHLLADNDVPEQVKQVLVGILREEEFHQRGFTRATDSYTLETVLPCYWENHGPPR